jgi:nucleotide-binding universal stress UspA family protein
MADAAVAPAAAQLAAVRIRYPSLPIDERIVDGTATGALGAQAGDARLLVIGRHAAGPDIDDPLGPVARELVESAPCPVLVAGRPLRGQSDSATGSDQAVR